MRPTASDMAAFRRYVRQDANGCWIWTGPADRYGYPRARLGGRMVGVHRWSLEVHAGPPGDGQQAGHTCHDRAVADGTCSADLDYCMHRRCVNPAHLEWQDASTNIKAQDNANARKTVCPAGHDLTDPRNVHVRPSGRRTCRACDRERKRAQD